MKKADTLLNHAEEVVFHELQKIASSNGLRAFSKVRLSDVINKGRSFLTSREFDFYTRSHCDFVVTDSDFRPLMIVEYDGPLHTDVRQQERDTIKNDLCRRAELGLLRINDNHVTKLYRGMTLLRWIIEVVELEKAFDEAKANGSVPYDEPFDPMLMTSNGEGPHFPYWLSAGATQSIHAFMETLDPIEPKGWTGILGQDKAGNGHRLSWLYFCNQILWTKTAVRKQDIDFPDYDLLNEIAGCELGIALEKYREGRITACRKEDFRQVLQVFCDRYNARLSHASGSFPFEGSWNFEHGFAFK